MVENEPSDESTASQHIIGEEYKEEEDDEVPPVPNLDDIEQQTNIGPTMTFALSPGSAITGVIDYSTTEGRKLYAYATSSIANKEEGFDCTAHELHAFLKEVSRRARQYGWHISVCRIPKDLAKPDEKTDLIKNHGELTLEEVTKWELTHIFKEKREAQDSHMLYQCLMNSLSSAGKCKVLLWEKDYILTDKSKPDESCESGPCLLKVILRESHLDTKATVASIRESMTGLSDYIVSVNCDIEKFNQHVMQLQEGLSARGEKSDDLLVHLFNAYMAVTDEDFVGYIKRLHDRYLEDDEDMKPTGLMGLASNKYKTLVLQKRWNAPTAQQEQIQALQTQLKKLKQARKVGAHRQKSTQHNKKDEKKRAREETKEELPRWMFERPKDGDLKKVKKYKNKEWWYCSSETGGKCDGMYRRHKPSGCKGTGKPNPYKGEKTPKKLKVQQAMTNAAKDDSGEESD